MRGLFFFVTVLPMKLRLTGQRPQLLAARQAAGTPGGFVWDVMAVAAGFSANYLEGTGLRMYHEAEDLKAAASLFEGRPVYALKFISEQYKPAGQQSEKYAHTPADVRDILKDRGLIGNVAGTLKNCRFGEAPDGTEGILAELHLLPSSAGLATKLSELWAQGATDFVGLSYDAYTLPEFAEVEGEPVCKLKLSQVNSLDVVTTPAAGGKLLRAVAELENSGERKMTSKLRATLAAFAYANAPKRTPEPAILRLLQSADETETKQAAGEVLKATADELRTAQGSEETVASIEQIAQMIQAGDAEGALAGLEALKAQLAATQAAAGDADKEKAAQQAAEDKARADAAAHAAQQAASANADSAAANATRLAALEAQQAALADTQTGVMIEAEVSNSALPDASKARVTQSLKSAHAGGKPLDRKLVTQAVESEQAYLAALATANNGLPLSVHSLQTRDTRNDAILALQGLVSGRDFTNERREVIPSFFSFREAYRAFMGRDVEDVRDLPEVFLGGPGFRYTSRRERFNSLGRKPLNLRHTEAQRFRALQEITTSDLASIFANVLHNALLVSYGEATELNDWTKIAKKVSLADLYAHKFSRRSKGRGAVPAVSEGGTYNELTDPVDEDIDLTASKFGGLAVITHEAIMKDRIDKLQNVSSELAYSVKQDIYREVFDYFVNNAAIYDGVTLIHAASHANGAASGGTALSPTSLKTGRIAMMDQTAYGDSRDVLGMRNLPKTLLVPAELEELAAVLTQSDRLIQAASAAGGYTSGQILQGDAGTPNLNKGMDYLVVPYWTDADNWVMAADPAKVPGILMGFLNGDETPELMSEAADSGVDFTADKKRFKVRQWRDSAVVDYRPFYAQFV
ncbi:MAG: hypothetical protein IPK72_21145 [Candidatus Eisenbacteria bacterium]|nr:hypothetical protein [Candidatus Eisenbacteria bacterium]